MNECVYVCTYVSVAMLAQDPQHSGSYAPTFQSMRRGARVSDVLPEITVISLSGETLAKWTPHDIDWPPDETLEDEREGRENGLAAITVLRFLRRRYELHDLCSGGRVLSIQDLIPWGTTCELIARRCSRCTFCGVACCRTEEHRLCCHGMTDSGHLHLWHIPTDGRVCGQACRISVQGYMNASGLEAENGARMSPEGIGVAITAVLLDSSMWPPDLGQQERWRCFDEFRLSVMNKPLSEQELVQGLRRLQTALRAVRRDSV